MQEKNIVSFRGTRFDLISADDEIFYHISKLIASTEYVSKLHEAIVYLQLEKMFFKPLLVNL